MNDNARPSTPGVLVYSWGHGPTDSVACAEHRWSFIDPGGPPTDEHPWMYDCTNEGCNLRTPVCDDCSRPVADMGKETGCSTCRRRVRASLPTFEEMLADPTFQPPVEPPLPAVYPHPLPSDTAGRCGCATCQKEADRG